jgi:hypothetical protein
MGSLWGIRYGMYPKDVLFYTEEQDTDYYPKVLSNNSARCQDHNSGWEERIWRNNSFKETKSNSNNVWLM